ncbi:hypothetical protein [Methylobrevis albus]|uniref:Uncharacterized protein n=1 Tax=Methylobrevis albus TaxID=2793297 RepID=A0A931MX34_9HYPH|nr:hypothetical protein [Methylobrevis albus]MBH0236452.1 hypothetical protein [Methylobrevis albus]
MTARVFVPLVGADGRGAQLFEAIAGEDAPEPHPAKLVPQIAELFDFGLYRIGQTVREAVVRFVDARRGRVWLGRRNARARPWFLRISDLQVGRLSDENARSAGLGLAAAALLEAFGRAGGGAADERGSVVFATGEIVLPNTPGSPAIAVGAVDGIRGKLGLIGDYLVQHRAVLSGSDVVVLLPAETVDGRPLEAAEARILDRLGAEAKAAGAKLRLVFARSLDDLEDAFGPLAFAEIVTPRRAAGLAALLIVAAVAGTALALLATAPVRLGWATVTAADAPLDAPAEDPGPRRARYDGATDTLELLPACFDGQRQPVVVGGETLLFRVSAEDGLPHASRVRPPRLFVASVSRGADPVILDAGLFQLQPSATGELVQGSGVTAIPIEPQDDEVRLFVVATRNAGIVLSDVLAELRAQLDGVAGPAVLSTTATFLQDRFDGQIDYQFKVTTDAATCP